MFIESIRLKNFRNFAQLDAGPFADGINLFVGPNGAGKTNLLEAIGLAALGKSCRGAQDSDLVAFGSDATIVEIEGLVEKKK
jgi:DNA replication and repair protein RecF